MGWRRLPDGSYFNSATGDVRGTDPKAEAQARAISLRQAGGSTKRPMVDRGAAHTKRTVTKGPGGKSLTVLEPQKNLLAVNPYELGVSGDTGTGMMSETAKRFLATGLLVAAAAGAVWIKGKFQ